MLTIEEAVKGINNILDGVEGQFHSKYKRYPSLLDEEDYVLLGEFLDIRKESSEEISIYDISYNLMTRFLKRQNFFNHFGKQQAIAFDGIMGRLIYHTPQREGYFRIEAIDKLEDMDKEFPTDWIDFIKTVGKIAGHYPVYNPQKPGICFLKSIYEKDKESYRIAFDKIGTWMVNPSAWFLNSLREVKNYDDLIKEWKRTFVNDGGEMYL